MNGQTEVFFKTTYELEVLSDRDITGLDIQTLAYEITNGDFSGAFSVLRVERLNKEEVAAALIAQGSDPAFLLGEDDGQESA